MREKEISYEKAFAMVKTKRPIALPNKGFTKQLKKFENQFTKMKKESRQKNDGEKEKSWLKFF
jgi:hypothetical protein